MKSLKHAITIEKIIWKTSPVSAFVTLMHALVSGFIPAVLSSQIERIIHNVIGDQSWRALVMSLSYIVLFYLMQSLLQMAYSVANNAGIFEKVNLSLRADFASRVPEWPAIQFEDVQFLNRIETLRNAVDNEELPMFHFNLMNHLQAIISILSLTALLYNYNAYLSLLAFLSASPILINRWMRGNAFNTVREKVAPESRKVKLMKSWFYQEPHAKELRVNDAYEKIEEKWKESYNAKTKLESEVLVEDYRQFEFCQMLKFLGFFIALLLSLYLAKAAYIELGMAAASILAFTNLQMTATDFFRTMGNGKYYLTRSAGILDLLKSIKDLPSDYDQSQINSGFELKNICFSYPGAESDALKAINLRIDKGERIGIVGANGSGKTTLAKVLIGLYPPTQGELQKERMEYVHYVPQDVPKFKLTLREYLNLGQKENCDDQDLLACLKQLNFDWTEADLSTVLGREFAGLEFSGGEWQRLAIVKSLLQEADLLVYDEATRAVDPMNESFVLERILEASKESTTIIITHRLAICPYLDKILVLNNGHIEAFGKHEELLNSSKLYQEIYESQSAAYK
ncbi:MAG: ABC transporter ATP-binding protein [Eubacteriales bacterium]|nr:ABC transporter ATP-binding protein [Eubacteriales bacterium]